VEQREYGRFLRRVRQRTRDRDRRMAAPPAGGTGSAKEPDRHGSTDLANAPSFPRAGDENTPGCKESPSCFAALQRKARAGRAAPPFQAKIIPRGLNRRLFAAMQCKSPKRGHEQPRRQRLG